MDEALLSTLFPMYATMDAPNRTRFTRFLASAMSDNVTETGLPQILRHLDIDLLVVSPQGHLVRVERVPSDPTTAVSMDRDITTLSKRFDREIRRQDQKTRLRSFLRTGIRSQVATRSDRPIQSFGGLAAQGNTNRCRPWSKLGAWHRKRVSRIL